MVKNARSIAIVSFGLLLVLLIAWTLRWEEAAIQFHATGKDRYLLDRWTGRVWATSMEGVSDEVVGCNSESVVETTTEYHFDQPMGEDRWKHRAQGSVGDVFPTVQLVASWLVANTAEFRAECACCHFDA